MEEGFSNLLDDEYVATNIRSPVTKGDSDWATHKLKFMNEERTVDYTVSTQDIHHYKEGLPEASPRIKLSGHGIVDLSGTQTFQPRKSSGEMRTA